MPQELDGSALVVAFEADPDTEPLRELAFVTGRDIRPVEATSAEIDAFLQGHGIDPHARPTEPDQPAADTSANGTAGDRPDRTPAHPHSRSKADRSAGSSADSGSRTSLGTLRFDGAAPRQVEQIINEAIARGASDIHIEPYEKRCRVRYRLDGVLHEAGPLDPTRRAEVTARIKILADLDIAEKRRPQDGRITHRVTGRSAGTNPTGRRAERAIDLRVSTLPTAFGEKVVLRLLDRADVALHLTALGLDPADEAVFRSAIERPHGMVLVTGPTGSGKTTTLYAALRALQRDAVNIQTIEDPIEYELPGINQAQARPEIGFTFAKALRAFLRQDPDIIMVGEVRDRETAEIAIRAALTGHLVLSTLHTNDAPGAAGRLLDMGVPPYLVASSVALTCAQRLVRRVCAQCKQKRPLTSDECAALNLDIDEATPCFEGTGCLACNGTGFAGRTALFELMPMSACIQSLITERASAHVLHEAALEDGMRPLRAAAAAKVAAGETTPGEAIRRTVL
jgi:type II secretory ATPase GspE/PulE/Tfp pilus assembly ATPase PilB-like protein